MRGGNDKFKTSAMTECGSSNTSLFFYFLAMCYLDLPSWIPILNFSFSWVEANLFIAKKMLAEFSVFITCPLKFFSIFLQWRQTYFIYRFRFFCFRDSLWICFMWMDFEGILNMQYTVCPPVAELAPRRFGPLFFGRQSGPGWRDF